MDAVRWRLPEVCQNFLAKARPRLRLPPPSEAEFRSFREKLPARFISGDGIEIGALHEPLGVSGRARVRYVDRMSIAELRTHYPQSPRCQSRRAFNARLVGNLDRTPNGS